MGVPPADPDQGFPSAYVTSLIRIKARQLCRRTGFRRHEREDLEQELTARLLETADRYDPARGASRDTFANRVIHSAVRALLRDRRRQKRGASLAPRSLAETAVVVHGVPVALADVVGAADLARRTGGGASEPTREDPGDVATAVAALPPDLREVAERLKGGNVAAVSRASGLSRQQVYRAIEKIRARFESAGLDRF